MEGPKQPNSSSNNNNNMIDQRRLTRAQKDQALNCPRCNSSNTKFCYYNNYSLTQPRYFCKTCRRYWTEGGSLRNVPVGGGSRKNKRSSSTTTTTNSSNSSSQISPPSNLLPSSSNKKIVITDHQANNINLSHQSLLPPNLNFPLNLHHHQSASQNPKLIHQGQDLNLAYPPSTSDHHHHHHHDLSRQNMSRIPFVHDSQAHHYNNSSSTSIGINPSTASTTTITTTTATSTTLSSPTSSSQQHELLKTGIASRGLMSSFMSMPPVVPDHHHHHQFSSFANLGHHEFKPSLSFGLEQYPQGGYSSNGVVAQETSARLLFPSEDLKQVSSNTTNTTATTDHDHGHQFEQVNRGQGDNSSSGGYNWNGMLGGGSW